MQFTRIHTNTLYDRMGGSVKIIQTTPSEPCTVADLVAYLQKDTLAWGRIQYIKARQENAVRTTLTTIDREGTVVLSNAFYKPDQKAISITEERHTEHSVFYVTLENDGSIPPDRPVPVTCWYRTSGEGIHVAKLVPSAFYEQTGKLCDGPQYDSTEPYGYYMEIRDAVNSIEGCLEIEGGQFSCPLEMFFPEFSRKMAEKGFALTRAARKDTNTNPSPFASFM